jgi:hypothetical protein
MVIYAVRTVDGTTATFGALKEIVEPLFQHLFGQAPRTRETTKNLAGRSEIPAIDGAQELGAQDRHVSRVA